MRFRGKGSEIARRTAIVANDSIVQCESHIQDPFSLRLVRKYKHHGGWLNSSADFTSEMTHRGALMSEAVHPIRRKFLHHPGIQMHDKKYVVEALVLSKGLHLAGTWPELNSREHDKIVSSLRRVFRQIVPNPEGKAHNGLDAGQIQHMVDHLAPLNYVRICRVALFARICRDLSPIVITLLHATIYAPRSWLRAVLNDLEFITTSSAKCRELGSLSFVEWVQYFRTQGKRGVMVLKKGISEASCNVVNKLTLPHHVQCEEEYVCSICSDKWPTKQQLAVHLARGHNRPHEIRRFLPYGVSWCQVCHIEKHTRAGIVEHYADKRNADCTANLMLRVAPASLLQSREWDLQAAGEPNRRKNGRTPAFRHIGPKLFIVGVLKQYGKPGVKHMALR